LDEPLSTAPELVIEPKPPEKDLEFTGVFHYAAIVQNVNEMISR